MADKINKISEETKLHIKNKTADGLPNNPSVVGYSPLQIKRYMGSRAMLDPENSIASEINRIVDEANAAFENQDTTNTNTNKAISDLDTKVNGLNTETNNRINELESQVQDHDFSINDIYQAEQRLREDIEEVQNSKATHEEVNAVDNKAEAIKRGYMSHLNDYNEVNNQAQENKREIGSIKETYETKAQVELKLQVVRDIAEGKTKTYVIRTYVGVPVISGKIGDDEFTTNKTTFPHLTNLGDILLIKDLDVPDYYVGEIGTNTLTFFKLETTKIDVDLFATKEYVQALENRLAEIEAIKPTLQSVASNETTRQSNESLRQSAEAVRQTHETERETYFNNFKDQYDSKVSMFEGAETLTEAEYEALATKEDKYYFVVEE